MYHVFFNRRPTRPRLPRALYEQLAALPLNTEVNVHTTNETHYNALFLGFEPRTNSVSLLVDRFYKEGALAYDRCCHDHLNRSPCLHEASSIRRHR